MSTYRDENRAIRRLLKQDGSGCLSKGISALKENEAELQDAAHLLGVDEKVTMSCIRVLKSI